MKRVLAFDFGASSGRAILGKYSGNKIEIEEIHRFENKSVVINNTLCWDFDTMLSEIHTALKRVNNIDSIAFDTWGVDFGLLDENGELLGLPVNYRDSRTKGMFDYVFERLSKEEMYKITGSQFMEINTVFQLAYLIKSGAEELKKARNLLMLPDLFNYFICGAKSTEISIASTTQLLDIGKMEWSKTISDSLQIPDILPKINSTGTVIGEISDSVVKKTGINKAKVISIASHDTQSAIASIPADDDDFIYISCGTWALVGTVLKHPIVNEKSKRYNISNEIGIDDTYDFIKNIKGLWLIHESRRQWRKCGEDYSFTDLETFTSEAAPFKCFIDPDYPAFVPEGDIPGRIQEYCKKTGQYVPKTAGEIVRCIYESLAMKYQLAIEEITDCTGKKYDTIHIVGGGSRSKTLCQMTANACNCKVKAGPAEATVFGSVAVQLMTLGEIKDISEARKIVAASNTITEYYPEDSKAWKENMDRFLSVIK